MAALPIPTSIWLLCLYVFMNAAFASKEDCGVDACGMAMGFSVIIAGAAMVGFFIGAFSAWLAQRIARP